MTAARPAGPLRRGREGFELLERIACGGMAEIHVARPRSNPHLPRLVAVKRLLPAARERAEYRRMFVDEARLVARLDHPNVITTYEHGEDYIVMQLVRGLSLYEVMRSLHERGGRMPVRLAVWIAEQVSAGLLHVHGLRTREGRLEHVVHRDITPHNVMLGFDGSVTIVDFGIAKSTTRGTRTEVGFLKGKVCYVAPEQVSRPRDVDRRADLYSLGVCLWELLAGRRRFAPGVAPLDVLHAVLGGGAPSLDDVRPELPAALRAIVARATALDPAERFGTAAALGTALRGFRRAQPTRLGTDLRSWLGEQFSEEAWALEARLRAVLEDAPVELELEELHEVELDFEGEGDFGWEDLSTAVHVSVDVEDAVPDVTVLTEASEPPAPDEAHPPWTMSEEIELPAPQGAAPTRRLAVRRRRETLPRTESVRAPRRRPSHAFAALALACLVSIAVLLTGLHVARRRHAPAPEPSPSAELRADASDVARGPGAVNLPCGRTTGCETMME